MDRLSYPWDGNEPGPAALHFQQLLSILRRRHRVVIATAAIGTSLVFLGGLMIPPNYTAKAQIVSETRTAYPGDERPALAQPDEEAALETHIAALTSRAHLNRALNNLFQDPDFHKTASQVSNGDQSIAEFLWLGFGARLRNWTAGLVAPGKLQDQSPTATEALRLDQFERRLTVYQERGSHVIAVTFKSPSPGQAALAANRVAQLYVESEDE